ncbi:MAG: PHP domain-containing protein, partial [Firmicutes bacterium]|nr:PHP domain-containing protein [Bacillota bacterium]
MHYRFQPGKKGISAKQLIESIGLQPADARLAFCSVDSVLVDKDDGSWKVRLKGPGELMPDAISAVREALRERMDHASIHISYEPSSKDGWIKGNWSSIAEEMSSICRINLGSLLSCEPSWNDRVCLTVPSEAQISSFLRRGLPASLGLKLEELTGIRADVELVCGKETTSDYSSALPEAPQGEKAPPKHETGQPAGDVIYGGRIKIPVSKIAEAKGDEEYIAFEGRAFKPEAFTSRRNRRMLSFVLSDSTGSVSCILAEKEGAGIPELPEKVKVAGKLSIDERGGESGGEPMLSVESIEHGRWQEEEATRLCQRVELHCHTKMSALDSVCDPFELVKRAKELAHSAIAVTDHGVVHAFPHFYKAAKELGLKSVFGMEGYLKDPDSEAAYHFTVLVKDRTGLKNLYRMVSKSHLENFRRHPIVPRELAEQLHEGLLYGTACASGELFMKALSGADDDTILKVAGFYDYVEVMPASNSAFLVREGKVKDIADIRDINRRLIRLAKSLGKPFVATGDVHFVMQEDAILRQVLLAGQDYRDFQDQPSLHLRSTEEMLDEFSYLGEKDALAAVVINPNTLVSMVEKLKPVPDGLFTPVIEGAGDEVREKAVRKARQLYGER